MLGKLPSYKERPVINSLFDTTRTFPEPRTMDLRTLIWWIKRTPEAIGIIKRMATDIVTEIQFNSVAEQKTGRPSKDFDAKKIDRAKYFAKKNHFRQKLIALVTDWIMTGDFYLWMGKISDNQVKEIALKHYKSYGIELKEIETKQFYDEDFNRINSIEVLPSSMTKIHHDDFTIIEYVQKPRNGQQDDIPFKPEEIIHGKFMEIDGSVYGFSPMESGYVALRTINSIQDYGFYYFENGAKIDRVWKFMGNPNPTYIEKFKEQIKQYTDVKRSHGNLVLTGADKIESESLNEVSEEMQYRQLAINSVGRLAFSFNMPADILSAILGVDIKGTATGSDIEDAGYNRNIEMAQLYIEEMINSQLWLPEFKVEMRFKRTFRQDQIRMIQYQSMVVPVMEFMFKHEFPVNEQYYFDLMQIPEKYREKGKIKTEIEQPQPFANPGKLKVSGEKQEAFAASKKSQQKPQDNNSTQTGA